MNKASSPSVERNWREEELAGERDKNIWRTNHYVLPLLERLFGPDAERSSIRILSAGCGNGEDVDTLIDAGYQAVGIDPGYRNEEWRRRKHKGCFHVADARYLPFEEGAFDMVLNVGVMEHIGAVGDTLEMLPDYQTHRKKFARELTRVTKPGGYILIATNNKPCPLDMWHGADRWGVRLHSPNEKFTVSFKEMKEFFCSGGDCEEAIPLGLENFFQFQKAGRHAWIRLLLGPIKAVIRIISKYDFLRVSFLNPFLIVLFRKRK